MSTNYLVNVPKLKGRENYTEWCFAAENFLILENMVQYIKPVAGKDAEAADDARTKAKLILTIDSSLYVHIKEVKTSLELWNKLRTNQFIEKSYLDSSRKLQFYDKLCDTVSGNGTKAKRNGISNQRRMDRLFIVSWFNGEIFADDNGD